MWNVAECQLMTKIGKNKMFKAMNGAVIVLYHCNMSVNE